MSTGISISSINRIKELAKEKRYAEALEILDTQNLDRSINPQFLRISGEIFRENKRYYDSRKYLLKAHKMSPEGSRILFELIQLHLELGHFSLAQRYYEEFQFYCSSDDIQKDYVEYVMKKATGTDVMDLAAVLVPGLENMPEERWNFEALLLFDKIGRRDKALEECQYILENYRESIYVDPVIEYVDGLLDVDACFYVYPTEERPDDIEEFGELIAEEKAILEADYLRMYPPEARIMVEVEDKEYSSVKTSKGKKSKKGKKKKTSKEESDLNNNTETDPSEKQNLSNETQDRSDAKNATTTDQEENEETIRESRERALDKILSKKIDREKIKESAVKAAKAAKEIDTKKARQQVKSVAEAVKGNIKKATDVLEEAVGVTASLSVDSVEEEKVSESSNDQIMDGIIEEVLEAPKKIVGQVVTNEELDTILPDSLEVMSAEELAHIEARKNDAASVDKIDAKQTMKSESVKSVDQNTTELVESSEQQITESKPVESSEQNTTEPIEIDKHSTLETQTIKSDQQTLADSNEVNTNKYTEKAKQAENEYINVTPTDSFEVLKNRYLKEQEDQDIKPLDSLGFITVVQSDVDEKIEKSMPDIADMLHQMIDNKEYYSEEDSNNFESETSYYNHGFEVEDYEFELYREQENEDLDEEVGEAYNISNLQAYDIYAKSDVLDFETISPSVETMTLKENTFFDDGELEQSHYDMEADDENSDAFQKDLESNIVTSETQNIIEATSLRDALQEEQQNVRENPDENQWFLDRKEVRTRILLTQNMTKKLLDLKESRW